MATYFGGKMRHANMQHMTAGVVSVEEEYCCTPLMPYLPLLGIAVNWCLITQLPLTNLAFLVLCPLAVPGGGILLLVWLPLQCG
jgi:hypothetical protein